MPRARNHGQFGCPTYDQARKIVSRFGGERNLALLIGCNRISVYRWSYARPYGSDGLIPTAQIDRIKDIARSEGIVLTAQDWEPKRITYDDAQLAAVKQAAEKAKEQAAQRALERATLRQDINIAEETALALAAIL
jgi:hypothetical protein